MSVRPNIPERSPEHICENGPISSERSPNVRLPRTRPVPVPVPEPPREVELSTLIDRGDLKFYEVLTGGRS